MTDNLPATTTEAAPLATQPRVIQAPDPAILDYYWRMAGFMQAGGWLPKGNSKEGAVVAMQYGAELGIGPMQAVQNISVVNGRPAVWGDMLLGICKASPVFDHAAFKEWYTGEPYNDSYEAHTQVKRIGNGEAVVCSYSVGKAKRAKLWGKSGPWTTDTDRMLKYRARAFACRDCFPDVLKGLHAGEEMASDMGFSNVQQLPPEDAPPQSRTQALTERVTASLPEPRDDTKAAGINPDPPEDKATPAPPPPLPPLAKDKNAAPSSPTEIAALKESIKDAYAKLSMDNKAIVLKNWQMATFDLSDIDKVSDLVDMMTELKGM